MARPRGIGHFLAHLKGLEDEYVVIGGAAAAILMEQDGLEFRATRDVDLVLLTNASPTLKQRITEYVNLERFNKKERTEGTPRYYRFRDPEDATFPEMIEIFARNEQNIEPAEGQYIIPVQSDEVCVAVCSDFFSSCPNKRNCFQGIITIAIKCY